MTIDSSWLHAFKAEAPHAFTAHRPFAPRAIFVDGQIRLMQGFQRDPITWDQFIRRQFVYHLEACLKACPAAILAFDDYDHVPRAKCMTQTKRRKHTPAASFGEQAELPCMVPEGERWTQCIANRTFKARVIELVLLRLPQILLTAEAPPQRRLIVDYRGTPLEYRWNPDERRVTCAPFEEGLGPLGEADVKFTRYADRFGRLLVHSIDGDSIPIALLHLERRRRVMSEPPQVAVYRMELTTTTTTTMTSEAESSGTKRNEEAREARKRKAYEYVSIPALHLALTQVAAQCTGRVGVPTHRGHEMGMLVALLALTGTDFSRGLPQLTGRSVYGFLPDLWGALLLAYDPPSMTLRVPVATDVLIAHLYRTKFPKHTAARAGGDLGAVLAALQASPMAPRVKATLPSAERIACTVRNVNWVLAYWGRGEDEGPTPDPVQPAYGYRALPSGATEYADVVD
jgi:hypothetical protein